MLRRSVHAPATRCGSAIGVAILVTGLMVSPTGLAAQAVDAVSVDSTHGTSLSIPHTTAGTDRLLVVGVTLRNEKEEFASSVKYDGINLTLVGTEQRDKDARVEIWRLVAPPVGTHNVVVTFNQEIKKAAVVGVHTFTGVDQANPIGAFVSGNGDSKSASVLISSAPEELVLSVIATKNADGLTAGPEQTKWWQMEAETDEPLSAASTQPGRASVTVSWTLEKDEKWALAAVTVRAKSKQPPDPPSPCALSLRDELTSMTYTGNDGTETWTDAWSEIGESDGPGAGRVQVMSPTGCSSSNCLRIGSNQQSLDGRGARRTADLGSATGATLTFTVARQGNGGSVTLAASANGGSTWTDITTFPIGGATPTVPTTQSFDLTPYMAPNTQIRFLGAGTSGAPSYFFADNVEIAYTGAGVASIANDDKARRLPSNGTQYTATFTVANNGFSSDEFDLLTTHPGTALSVISIAGPSVTQGEAPDSALLSGAPAGDSTLVTVTYVVPDVPDGARDTLSFVARSRCDPAIQDEGRTAVRVVRPLMITTKAVTPGADPVPGVDLAYTLTITNDGSDEAHDVILLDSLAVEVQFKVGSVNNTFPPDIGVLVEYSDDAGTSWTYTPVSEGCGAPVDYDGCVTHIRWSLQDPLIHRSPDNTGTVTFVVRIE